MNMNAEKRWGQNDVNFQSITDHPSLVAAPKGGATFAEVLKGFSIGVTKCVEAKESGVEWLHKSVEGKLTNFCLVNTLQDLFISNSIWDGHIRPLGGLNVLISFDTVDSLEEFMLDKNRCLPQWFSSVEIWQNQRIKASRNTWISCYGVPVNACNS
ncbi:hypothetical protein Vadar_004089 [Vaccinium darrowii]|uniref:Uncharacterized protein n=1 Tax=Vaccinium darrowii TaxID=229202 RepID=A0ACB7ZHB6_9ERIC|nr:hypothetical protein Vadar_004089 [Vaccinium darrowii]